MNFNDEKPAFRIILFFTGVLLLIGIGLFLIQQGLQADAQGELPPIPPPTNATPVAVLSLTFSPTFIPAPTPLFHGIPEKVPTWQSVKWVQWAYLSPRQTEPDCSLGCSIGNYRPR